MKIQLVYPTIGLGPSYSCGVGSIAAVLKQAGHQVNLRNLASLDGIGPLCESIADEAPEVIAFAATSCQFEQLKQVMPRVRAVSQAKLVCGGIHPTVQPDCLEDILLVVMGRFHLCQRGSNCEPEANICERAISLSPRQAAISVVR